MPKTFRDILDRDGPIVGAFLQWYSPELVEIMADAGYDYVILDMEHGQMTEEQISVLIRTAEAAGIAPQVRIPEVREDLVKHMLDMGATSLKLPGINSAAQARELVKYAKFPPLGERGACPYVRANHWGSGDKTAYYEKANRETTLAVIVESPEGIADIENIIRVEGIDVIGVGKVDLAVAMGIPGQTDHPRVQEALRHVSETCAKYGKFCGTSPNTPEDVVRFKDIPGMKYFNTPAPQVQFYEIFRRWSDGIRAFFP